MGSCREILVSKQSTQVGLESMLSTPNERAPPTTCANEMPFNQRLVVASSSFECSVPLSS